VVERAVVVHERRRDVRVRWDAAERHYAPRRDGNGTDYCPWDERLANSRVPTMNDQRRERYPSGARSLARPPPVGGDEQPVAGEGAQADHADPEPLYGRG